MDHLWVNVPPVTKAWCGAISSTAALISLKRINMSSLVFMPDRAFTNEPWRLFTSFCTLSEISVNLFLELFYIRNSSGRIENIFKTNLSNLPSRIIDQFNHNQRELLLHFIEKNRHIDYLYYLFQISISIILTASLLHYKFDITLITLGQVLCRVLGYIDSQNNPHEMVHFMGILWIRRVYFPWVTTIVYLIPSRSVREDLFRLISSRNLAIFKNPSIWAYILCIYLGHFWWVIRNLLLSDIHYDQNDRRRELKRDALKKYRVLKLDLTRECLMWLLIPPWYWVILSKIKNRR